MFAWRDKSKKRKIATEAATPPARHVPPLTSEPLHSLRGTGSSSKVLYKLGAPVTLAGELDSELAITRRPSDASADSVSVGAGTQQSQRSGSHTSSSRATPSKPTLPLLRRRRSSLADIQDMPNSRQSSAMSSDSLLPSPSLIASSASSLNANDTPPNSAPSHMIGFPESGSSTLEYKPSHRSAASSKKSYASSNGRRYEKHRPTHSPIPSVNSNTKSDEIPTLQSTPKLYSSPPSSKLRSTPHEASAEDATEEIVPWMFDNSSRHEDEPDTQPFPRQRRSSGSGLSSGLPKILRGSSSASNLAGTSQRGDDSNSLYEGSVYDATPRQKKLSSSSSKGGFFGMLKKKPSKADINAEDAPPPFSDPFRLRSPSMTSLSSAVNNARKPNSKKSKDDKKSAKKSSGKSTRGFLEEGPSGSNGGSSAQQAAAGATGFTLDTNFDQMDGIISQDSLASNVHQGGYLNESANRPSTSDSLHMPHRRQGSFAHSSRDVIMTTTRKGSGDQDSGATSSQGGSPLSKDSSRRPSLAMDASIWQPGLGFKPSGPEGQNVGMGISVARPDGSYAPVEDIRPPSAGQTQHPHHRWHHDPQRRSPPDLQTTAITNAAARAAHAQQLTQQQQQQQQQSQAIDLTKKTEAGWTAPESWDVEEVTQTDADEDVSDEDAHVMSSPAIGGLVPSSPLLGSSEEYRRESLAGRQMSIRPGTSGSFGGASSLLKGPNFAVRIFKPDNTHTTLLIPFGVPVSDIISMVSRKPGFINKPGRHSLYLREKGSERALAVNEKPVRIQQLRFEQAGYSEWDKPEDLGREDHSYMIKFIFKPDDTLRFGSEDFRPDSFEYIDLRDRNLSNIPIFLYNHAHEVVSLNLSRNPKPDLPSDFVQLCTALRELRMGESGMKRVPQSLRQAGGLTRLDISNNRVLELDHINLSENFEIMLIEAFNNRIFSLPAYFGEFKALKYLDFSNNKFEKFPKVLCEIGSLTDLDLSFNLLSTLPEELGRMNSLERLILTANSISNLPSSMGPMIRLYELDIRHNMIEDISSLRQLHRLVTLKASYNKIASISLESATLRTAILSYNPATSFTIDGVAPALARLDFSYCKLADSDSIQALPSACPSLEELILDSNSIRKLPTDIKCMQNLIRISVINNNLEALPADIGELPRLQHLILPNNDLHEVPASVWNFAELITLNLSSNLLNEFPDPPAINSGANSEPPDVDRKMSTASKLSITSKMSGTAPGPSPLATCLQNLTLADNRLSDETFHPVSLMTELRTLNLGYNEIFEIPPKCLPKNTRLEELYLSGCMLTTLPEDDIEKLQNLRILHINGNKLSTLPAELGTLKKLVVLDAGSNVLKYNIANWRYDWNWNWNLELRYLNLSGNKRLEIKPAGPQAMHGGEDVGLAAAKRRNLSDFTALRKIRNLGLMDVTLTITNVPDDTEERRVRTSLSEINNMAYGISDTIGTRDALSIVDLVHPKFRGSDDECIFGMFDSQFSIPQSQASAPLQTDARLARFLQDCFGTTMQLELQKMEKMVEGEADVSDVLRRTFLTVNRDYGNIVVPAYLDSRVPLGSGDRFGGSSASVRGGASGVVAYVSGKTLYVANAGRALGVMAGRNGLAKPLTTSHDPHNRDEWTKVRTAEGFVSSKGLVNDEIDVSRSFGHFHVFPAVNASPTITIVELTDQDELVILANRGFWDFVDFQSAVDIARAERNDTMVAAQKLRDLAIAYGSKSHIMVMVVSVADLFKAKLAPKRRGIQSEIDGENSYAIAKAAASRARGGNGVVPTERYLSLMDREIPPPTGSVALVFTDIRNSTALWESNAGMQVAIRMHNQLLRRQLRAIGGYEVKTEGDAFMCSFPSVTSALLWAFTVQLELLHQDWPQSILDCEDGVELYDGEGDQQQLIYRGISVRMGIHWGQPHCELDPITRRMDYFGPMVNRSARVESVAEGGQITASADVIELVKELCGFHSDEPGQTASLTEEEFEELDEVTKRDINAIRSMGVCITELGEKKLKGLETSEFISLLYPKALAGRLKFSATAPSASSQMANATQTLEPVPHLLDVIQIQALGSLTLRAEAAASARTHPAPHSSPQMSLSPSLAKASAHVLARKRKHSYHPHLADYPIALDATDDELLAILEGLVIRLENLNSALMLHQLGPYNEVLGALSQASQVDPGMILQALSMFAGLMGQNTQGMPPAPHL